MGFIGHAGGHCFLWLQDRQPTTYSLGELVDASRLAHKIVANYGLSEAGITIWATPLARLRDPAGLLEVLPSYSACSRLQRTLSVMTSLLAHP